jgi:hypothetical protein
MMKKQKTEIEDEPIRYWFIEHTLTSGEAHTFYVKAKDQSQAYKVAGEWAEMMETIPGLKGFKLRY